MSSWTESEWDELQQGWMLALAEYQSRVCVGCGHQMHVAADEEHDWDVQPVRCWACDAIAQAKTKDQRLRPEALRWYSRRR